MGYMSIKTEDDVELKRCPFCGGEAEIVRGDEGGYYVECQECLTVHGAKYLLSGSYSIGIVTFGIYNTEQEAIEAWNRRAE